MSSGADCYFTEVTPGQWTYSLQQWPYGDSQDYDTFGPFAGHGKAVKHLSDHHQNPGGWSSQCLPEGQHLHEYTPGGQVITGMTVQIQVQSLGPNVTPAQAVAHIQSLPVDHPAFRTWATYGYSDTILTCESCGQVKP